LAAPSKRAQSDATITEILAGMYEPDPDGKRPPECLYGSLKMWAHLQRQGIPVARCTVEKIMRAHGWRGATRARRPPRTTESDLAANRAPGPVLGSTTTSGSTPVTPNEVCIKPGMPQPSSAEELDFG
jgi:transposase InsO family protein